MKTDLEQVDLVGIVSGGELALPVELSNEVFMDIPTILLPEHV